MRCLATDGPSRGATNLSALFVQAHTASGMGLSHASWGAKAPAEQHALLELASE